MQSVRRVASQLLPGVRRMGTDAAATQEKFWAKCFPEPAVTPEQVKKNVSKEMLGFMLLGTFL